MGGGGNSLTPPFRDFNILISRILKLSLYVGLLGSRNYRGPGWLYVQRFSTPLPAPQPKANDAGLAAVHFHFPRKSLMERR